MRKNDIGRDEYALFYANYIAQVPEDMHLSELFDKNFNELYDFFRELNAEKLDYSYELGKWTLKEIFLHIIDTERVMAYRALRFARKDFTDLPGYDQDVFVANSNAKERGIQGLLEEYKTVRNATKSLFRSFSEDDLKQKGTANETPVSVRAIGFIIIGHEIHHLKIARERYFN